MVFPRLLQRLDHAIAQSEAPLDRECLKAERVAAMARLGMMVEARMALAQLKAHLRRQTEPRLQGWVTFAEAVVAYCSDSESTGCWRRFKIEPPCRLNFEPGLMASP